MSNWALITKDATALDFLNLAQGWQWPAYRRKWLNRKLKEKLEEESQFIDDLVARAVFKGDACWMRGEANA
jgi:hypothetical protein